MADIKFVNGLLVKAPNDKAPDYVKGSISINVKELSAWLKEQSDEWINVDVKESKGGKWYAAVSTFKPKEKSAKPAAKSGGFNNLESDIPFSKLSSKVW